MNARFNVVLPALVVCSLLSLSHSSFAQQQVTRTIGLSASIQSAQSFIVVPIFVGDRLVLAPGVALSYAEGTGTDLGLALGPKFYTEMGRIAPYLALRGAAFVALPSGGSSVIDWLFGIAFGGDYFVNPRFSFGVEAQLNATVSDNVSPRFGNPGGVNLDTAAAVNVTIYIK